MHAVKLLQAELSILGKRSSTNPNLVFMVGEVIKTGLLGNLEFVPVIDVNLLTALVSCKVLQCAKLAVELRRSVI